MHFTTNGTDPTPDSPVWKGPLTLKSTTTLKAMTTRTGMRCGGITATAYVAGDYVPPTIVAARPGRRHAVHEAEPR